MSTVNIDWKYLTVARPRLRCEEDFYTKYRVSLKKVGLVFRASYEVLEDSEQKVEDANPYLILNILSTGGGSEAS